jgi:hypothetical protein
VRQATQYIQQQNQADALRQQANIQNQQNQKIFEKPPISRGQPNESPSITTDVARQQTQENYIPRTYEENVARGGELFRANQALYNNDPQVAIQAAVEEDARNQSINNAYKERRQNEKSLLNDVKGAIQNEAERFGVKIPGNEYTPLENEAKRMFNEGISEEKIKDVIGKKADAISRDYQNLKNLGPGLILGREPRETLRSMEALRKKFADRDQLENFMDTLVSDLKLSPEVAAYYTYPVKENKELSSALNGLNKLSHADIMNKNLDASFDQIEQIRSNMTEKVAADIAEKMGKTGSPLATAMYLKSKGYDPHAFLNYLSENRKQLNLTESQGRELDKPRNFLPTLSDNWFLLSTGLDKLVEE